MFSCRDKKQIPSDEVIGEIVRSAYAKDYFLEIFKKEDLPLNPNLVKLANA